MSIPTENMTSLYIRNKRLLLYALTKIIGKFEENDRKISPIFSK